MSGIANKLRGFRDMVRNLVHNKKCGNSNKTLINETIVLI
jgi:hypothetical protein